MGDPNRHHTLAAEILRQFPPAQFPRVADVAGGQGRLSLLLAAAGYSPTVFDLRATDLPKRERKDVRIGKRPGFARLQRRFDPGQDARDFDLVVGLHPDGATEAIVHAADYAAVLCVPCCNYWVGPEIAGRSVVEAIRHVWHDRDIQWSEKTLPMSGANLVLATRGLTHAV